MLRVIGKSTYSEQNRSPETPLAVVMDAEGLTVDPMQSFSNWIILSETVFVFPPESDPPTTRFVYSHRGENSPLQDTRLWEVVTHGWKREAGPAVTMSECALEVRAIYSDESGQLREDPETGVLHAALAQWFRATGRSIAPYLASQQGSRMGRSGPVRIDEDADGTIWVGRGTETVIRREGEISLCSSLSIPERHVPKGT